MMNGAQSKKFVAGKICEEEFRFIGAGYTPTPKTGVSG
jgi:hypothetical protein